MAVDYPAGLRAMIQPGQARSIQPAFTQAQPAIGPPYTEALTTDAPFEYTFQLVFKQIEAAVFWSWFNSETYCNRGLAEFNIPVRLEGGYDVDQLVRFTSDGIPQMTSVNGASTTYSCRVVGRSLDVGLEDPDWPIDFYLANGADNDALKSLDTAINNGWPE